MALRWPVILKSTHESFMDIMRANLESRSATIEVLKGIIKERDDQIAALAKTWADHKCNDYTSKVAPKPKVAEFAPSGRGGWRARAELASNATIPAPSDSSAALDKRVKEQGGTV